MILAVPAATPLTIPVPVPTEAIDELELLHTPPVVVELSVVLAPWHIDNVPVIEFTVVRLFTVTIVVAMQPPETT